MSLPIPTSEQARQMKEAGIAYPFLYSVIQDDPDVMIIAHCISKDVRYIRKEKQDGEADGCSLL